MDRNATEIYDLIGDEEADRQHREIFEKYDEIMDAVRAQRGRGHLLRLLEQLEQCARTHFATEKQLFDAYGYPDAAAHLEEHRHFTIELWTLKSTVRDEDVLEETVRQTVKSLVSWLSHHVSKTDVAAGEFIRQRKALARGPVPEEGTGH